MKLKSNLQAAGLGLALLTLTVQPSTVFAQGSLTPPGAPAPTMKTLSQVEPRTPITSLPVTITEPGSYYLTGSFDLSSGDGIFISAVDVTIDLNGFTIRSFDSTTSGVGIRIDPSGPFHDITILNGHIVGEVFTNGGSFVGNGFGYGIYAPGAPANVRVVGVTVSGCKYDGINIGINSTVVESCTVQTVGGYGIVADNISHSAATQCGFYAIFAIGTASDCYGNSIGSHGVDAQTANNCYGISGSNGDGVQASSAINCYGSSVNGRGVVATTAMNCYGYSSSNTGLYAGATGMCCYGASSTGTGFNAYIANSCSGIGSPDESVVYKYNMP